MMFIVAIAVSGGAAAYQMGNLIGAREGMRLLFNSDSAIIVILIGLAAGLILFIPSLKIISTLLGILVMLLGASFLYTAISLKPDFWLLIKSGFVPHIPESPRAPFLILGLIGTTIVPYNLFLGSGLGSHNTNVRDMRFGLILAVLLGGIFSIAVLITGASTQGEFSFLKLAETLDNSGSDTGKYLLGGGLFAAGFTSSITAPLAASITLKSLYGKDNKLWNSGGRYFRLASLIVLATGLFFALIDLKPLPAIVFAQILNGFILPFTSFFLVWILNRIIKLNLLSKVFFGITLTVTMIIGLKNLLTVVMPSSTTADGKLISYLLTAVAAIVTILFLYIIKNDKSFSDKAL